ncbi:MAG: IspD/TarI family cytidylyltransferase [Sphaerochaetaceae bacterium]
MSFPPHAVVITAAGSSERFISSHPEQSPKKELVLLDDRTVLYHAVEPFMTIPNLRHVIVTYPELYRDECESALDNLLFAYDTPISLVPGGKTRQESVYRALEYLYQLDSDISLVAIHDGARPFITQKMIIELLATASVAGGTVPAVNVTDAIKKVDEHGLLVGHLDRTNIVTIQTPQVFRYPEILLSHQKAKESSKVYVDDSEIYTDGGYHVATVRGDAENIKITTYDDIVRIKES